MTHLYANVNVNFMTFPNRLAVLTNQRCRLVSGWLQMDNVAMKRFLTPLAALVFAAPVWAQDEAAGSATDATDGPAQSDIADLLELLNTDTAEASAGDDEDTAGGLSLRGDDGSELEIPAAGSGDEASGGDAPADAPDDSGSGSAAAETGDAQDASENDSEPAEDSADDSADGTDPADETAEIEAPGPDGEAPAEDAAEDTPQTSTNAEEESGTGTADDSDPVDGAETAMAEPSALALTPATPFLTSTQYLELRPESTGEALQLVWSVRRENAEGETLGDAATRTLVIAPGFVRDESPDAVSVYDFLTSRHLEIDPDAGTMTNIAFAAEVRRRLDTYLGLSQGGRLSDIPLGPDRSFHRFWLEAAMGIRREPAALTRAYDDGALTVERNGGETVLSARFDVGDLAGADADAGNAPESAEAEADQTGPVSISDAARPVDLSSGESVVFDLSQAASPINLQAGDAAINYPDGNPAEQAQAELLRRWMRHALPVHPDALGALEGAPRIPEEFAFFVVSPESPDGRREIWTLQSVDAVEPGLRLAPGLAPAYTGRDLIADRLVPAARSAIEDGYTADQQRFLDELEAHRASGDFVRAYLVSLQELNHNGACPPAAQSALRPVCAEVSGLIAAGLGDSAFEQLFGLIAGPVGTGNEQMVEAMAPYRGDDNLAGAAARVLTAKALLAWAARDPEGPPGGLSPFDLFAEAIELDPAASGVWWETGNALLVLRDPLSGWTVFDTGRSVLPEGEAGLLQQAAVLEDRLRTLAPEFFLPR